MLKEFTYSLSYDIRLAEYDIRGSMAWAKMLAREGILTRREGERILKALKRIGKEIRDEGAKFRDAEDIHTAIEERLEELVGEMALKLRAGRSRNDQVVTDLRLYLKEKSAVIIKRIESLQKSLVKAARRHLDTVMPGLTHLQPAQPVLFSHHLLAYHCMLQRDKDRFKECLKRTDILPLGSAALSGTSIPVDRRFLARELGFSCLSENSIDAVGDRDFVLEFLSHSAIMVIHLSRLAEEFILWASPGFGFIEIDETFCTGSSMMPQKKNPDVLELIRARTGRIAGHFVALGIVLKGLPLAYNRDLQEDKEGVFDTVEVLEKVLSILPGILKSMKVNKERMRKHAETGFLNATDCAEYLVRKGIPFRKAHQILGRIVTYCLEKQKRLEDLTLNEFQYFSRLFDEDVYKYLSIEECIKSKDSMGSTSPKRVKKEIKKREK